jgi:hypothetical protein
MALDGIFSLLEALGFVIGYWRVLLWVASTSALGILLAQILPWFTWSQGLALAGLGLVPGVSWQMAAEARLGQQQGQRPPPATHKALARGLGVVIGLGWGLVFAESIKSFGMGVILFVLLLLIWLQLTRDHPSIFGERMGEVALAALLGSLLGGGLGQIGCLF